MPWLPGGVFITSVAGWADTIMKELEVDRLPEPLSETAVTPGVAAVLLPLWPILPVEDGLR